MKRTCKEANDMVKQEITHELCIKDKKDIKNKDYYFKRAITEKNKET